MKQDEELFHKILGGYIGNALASQYNGYLSVIFRDNGDNYLRNKCDKAAKAEEEVLSKMKFKLKSLQDEADRIVEFNSNLIFSITALPEEKQRRVYKLVQKLEQEENGK